MASIRNAVRQSFFAHLAVGLVEGSTDQALLDELDVTDGRYTVTIDGTDYLVAPKTAAEPLDMPGVNVVFDEEVDVTDFRIRPGRRRFVLPVAVIVQRLVSGGTLACEFETRELCDRITQLLAVGECEIWNYETSPATPTGRTIRWHDERVTWTNESDGGEGGDIRFTLDFGLSYAEAKL